MDSNALRQKEYSIGGEWFKSRNKADCLPAYIRRICQIEIAK